jgi:hypothetical protein
LVFTVRPENVAIRGVSALENQAWGGSLDGPVLMALGDWIDRTGSLASAKLPWRAVRRIRRGREAAASTALTDAEFAALFRPGGG